MKKFFCGFIILFLILNLFSSVDEVYASEWDTTATDVDTTETVEAIEVLESTEPTETLGIKENDEADVPYVPCDICELKTTATSTTKVKLSWKKEEKEGYNYKIYLQNKNGKYKLLGETQKSSYSTAVKKNTTYNYKVVAYYDKKKLSSGKTIKFVNKEYVSLSSQKYTYNDLKADIKGLSKKYGEYISYKSIGKSEEGRVIYDVVLGNPNASKCILVVSNLHAREYITSLICMKQIEYYLINYNKTIDGVKPANVFKNCCIHYIVMANPDGVTLCQSKSSKARWKANANGIDLNRNFPYMFVSTGDAEKGNYNGDEAGCAKETQVIMAFSESLKNQYGENLINVNYHAQGRILFWDYLGEDALVASKITKMTKVAQKTTGYRKVISDGEPGNGNYREYMMYILNIPSITLELGTGGAPVDKKYYNTAFEKNKFLILREAQIL